MALTIPVAEIVANSKDPLLQIHPSWDRILLKDVARVINGYAFKSDLFNTEGKGIPLIRIRDVGKDSTDTYYDGPYDPSYFVEPGDLLIGMDGDFNCDRWRGPKGLLNQRVCKVVLNSSDYLPGFLDLVLPGYLKAINEKTSSVTVKHLSSSSVLDIPLPFPSNKEQSLIVEKAEELLTDLNSGVSSLQRVQANLKRYKASLLKAACEGRLVPTEAELARQQARPYQSAAQLLQRILTERRARWEAEQRAKGKDPSKVKYPEPQGVDAEGLPELPEGWVWAAFDQIGTLARGKSRHRPRNDPNLYGGIYPFIQTGEVRQSEGLITSYYQTYNENGLKQSRLWPKGTLCITIAANIAETGILGFEACFPDSVVGFIPSEELDVRFFEFFLRTAKEDLERYAPATAQKNINLEILQSLAIPFPSLAEQRRIVAEVERLLSVTQEVEGIVEADFNPFGALAPVNSSKCF